jgi:hypothetical protein
MADIKTRLTRLEAVFTPPPCTVEVTTGGTIERMSIADFMAGGGLAAQTDGIHFEGCKLKEAKTILDGVGSVIT